MSPYENVVLFLDEVWMRLLGIWSMDRKGQPTFQFKEIFWVIDSVLGFGIILYRLIPSKQSLAYCCNSELLELLFFLGLFLVTPMLRCFLSWWSVCLALNINECWFDMIKKKKRKLIWNWNLPIVSHTWMTWPTGSIRKRLQ